MVKKLLSYKGGVDITDQRMESYTTKYKTRKSTLVALSYVLNTVGKNSQAINVIKNAERM